MRFENDKMVVWYGTDDAPAPFGVVVASSNGEAIVTITAGVQPRSVGNAVLVTYRLNKGDARSVAAVQSRQDPVNKAHHFTAKLPPLHAGDTVDYAVIARSPAGQTPSPAEAAKLSSTFHVVAAPGADAHGSIAPNGAQKAATSQPHAAAPRLESPSSTAPAKTASSGSAESITTKSSSPSSTASSGKANGTSSVSFTKSALSDKVGDLGSDSQLDALLAASSEITGDERTRFVSLYGAHKGTMGGFWAELEKDPHLGHLVPRLQLMLQLGTVTYNDPQLVRKLLTEFHPASIRDLTKLNPDVLAKTITDGKIVVPKTIAAATTPATIARYADDIAKNLHEAFPSDYLAKSLGASEDTIDRAVATLVSKTPDVDLEKANVTSFIAEHVSALPKLTEQEHTAVVERLKAVQRLLRITKDETAIRALLKVGLDSSYKIAACPRGSFLDQHERALGGREKAAQIHANATSISAVTSHIITHVHENRVAGMPRMIAGGGSELSTELDSKIPNWQTLFGSSSSCDCSECRSIDGPAAYFVSLLQFLAGIGGNAAHRPLEVLLKRRPDLIHLKLDCANADTALPYVDLVNEILETYVAHGKMIETAAHDTPVEATSDALGVNPEYAHVPDAIDAYHKLNSSKLVHPFTLPFDRDLETIRSYLSFLGVSRHELLAKFGLPQPANSAASIPLAAEYLQLTESEYIVITNTNFAGEAQVPRNELFKVFGYAADDHTWQTKSAIEQVPEFLSRASMDYGELVVLLQTQYLNPLHAIALETVGGSNPCDITAFRIGNVEDFLPPLPAFIRLRKKLGWSIAELDYALRSFQVTPGAAKVNNPRPIPPSFLLVAAQIKALRETLDLSIGQTIALWGDIDTNGRSSHYNSLFANKVVINPPDPGLALVYRAPLASLKNPLPEHWSDGSAQSQVVFDASAKQLRFTGSMTDHQRDDLATWAGSDVAAAVAVRSLYDQWWFAGPSIRDVAVPRAEIGAPIHSAAAPLTRAIASEDADSTSEPIHTSIVGPLNRDISVPKAEVASPSHASAAPIVLTTAPEGAGSIAQHIHTILAGLRISAADLVAIGQDAGFCDPLSGHWQDGTLTLGNLSMLYRYTLLARSLEISIADLIALEKLTGIQPFAKEVAKADVGSGPITDPLVKFVDAARQVRGSKFTVAKLAYLYGVDTAVARNLVPLHKSLDGIISSLLVGLQNVAAANVFAPDPTGAALRKKLTALLPSASQVNAVIGLIGGGSVTMSPLAALPGGVVLPESQVSFGTTITIAGTATAEDTLTLSVASSAIAGSPLSVTYSVTTTDDASSIAAALATRINALPSLALAGFSAFAEAAIIGILGPAAASSAATWTVAQSPGATETAVVGGSLFCTGPMSDVSAATLLKLSTEPSFSNAVALIYAGPQSVLNANLNLVASVVPLSALPAGVTLPLGPVSFVPTVTIGNAFSAHDVLSLTVSSSGLAGSSLTVSYTVTTLDTAATIAAAFAAQINGNATLATAGIFAIASNAAVSLLAPRLLPAPVWTVTAVPSATGVMNIAGGLMCYGALPKSNRSSLLALSNDANYTSAVSALFDQAHAANQSTGSVIACLVNGLPLEDAAERYNAFLKNFLAYLADTQSRNLVKQSLSDALHVDAVIIELLLDGNSGFGIPCGLLASNVDPDESALVDFLGGLSATYYSSAKPEAKHASRVQIDAGVALTGAHHGFGSVSWVGKLLAPTSGSYTFAVPVTSASPGFGAAAHIALTIGGQPVSPAASGGAAGSVVPIELTAGQLYDFSLVVSDVPVNAAITLQWCISPAPPGAYVTIPALSFMPCAIGGAYPSLALLKRIAVLISGFGMVASEIAYLTKNGADFAGIDPVSGNPVIFSLAALASATDAPALFNQWQRLDELYRLKSRLPAGDVTLFDVFATASGMQATSSSVIPAESAKQLVADLLSITRWQQVDLLSLIGTNGFRFHAGDFRNEMPFRQLIACIDVSSRIGVSPQKLFQWAQPTQVSKSAMVAQDIVHTTKAKYGDSNWLKVGKSLNDKLREHSKGALIAYILQMPQMRAYTDANDLYGYFLIDVAMCTCMETSRLVQANAAVQLFVQRCLLNLESDVKPSAFTAEDIQEWNEFRKDYRVWQAAVEVRTYPENWLAPELRSDKTPFFEDLESALLQGDINSGTVQAAYTSYLEALQQVARLEIVGIYYDFDMQAGTDMTYVVGRTFSTPHLYFYRTVDYHSYLWSPWMKIDADISGDNLIPVVWNRRFHLFWPIYSEGTDLAANTPPAASLSQQNSAIALPQSGPALKTLQVHLAWSELKGGKWTPKQTSATPLVPAGFASYSSALDTTAFAYTANPSGRDGDALRVSGFATVYLAKDEINVLGLLVDTLNASLPKGSSTPSGSDLGNVLTALTPILVLMGQLELVHVPANAKTFTDLQKTAMKLSTLMQAVNSGSTSTSVAKGWSEVKATLTAAYKQLRNQTEGTVSLELGSFYFDGPQGTVEAHPPFAPPASLPGVAAIGGSHGYVETDPKFVTEFFNQDIALKDQDFELQFANFVQPKPSIVRGLTGPISTIDITFPQQSLPSYCLEIDAPPGAKTVALADSRRTFLVTHASPPPKAPLKDVTKVSFSGSVSPESLYFFNHHHPWVGDFIKRLNWQGIGYLLDPSTQALSSKFDESHYRPERVVAKPYPVECVDFGQTTPSVTEGYQDGRTPALPPAGDAAYSIYNWEIFFHVPLLIANALSRNHKFADAQTWYHYIFNPTQDPLRKGMPSSYKSEIPNGYWNFQPLNLLDKDGGLKRLVDSACADEATANAQLNAQLQAWTQDPFDPDVIARLRPVAYQKTVVMRYVDNLIKWGDSLFTQNTRESIYEAIQYYILADQIWGRKPVVLPALVPAKDLTFDGLLRDDLNQFGNAQVQLENAFPLAVTGKVSTRGATGASVLATGQTPYFCTPANPTLFAYYDTIADRLYKIRHCMNIEGQVEELALFSPPIDPGLLVDAAADGVDLSSVLGDIGAAVPHYRFSAMLAKALELCSEVKSLGGAVLTAQEKCDAEEMAQLRSGQEISVLRAVRQLKQMQIDEASENLAALEGTLAVTTGRQTYYQGLVSGGISAYETAQITAMTIAEEIKLGSQMTDLSAAAVALIPQFDFGINGAMGTPSVHVVDGGDQDAKAAASVARGFNAMADGFTFIATMAGMMGGWDRRGTEWAFQLESATLEVAQIKLQVKAAEMRVKIAKQDLANQNLQVDNAAAVQATLKSKFTNKQLYSWMVGEVSGLFFQCYQMAYDLAKRAEVCYRFELGVRESNYIQFGYWDSLKKGLLAGEKLFKDLKRLEGAYFDQNKREYEISKSISLLMLNPSALITLKLTGVCLIELPEAYFDMDYPGHYMRRIRSVNLTIPCVTGPYTSVNCTLTLLQSKIRLDGKAASVASYPEKPIASDSRFCYNFAAAESIATSTAQSDSGMFEVNFRDERYLPFEGSGAISQWQLSMPSECNAFDFATITDVILNLRYTAREGGDAARSMAKAAAVLPPRTAQSGNSSRGASPQQKNLQRGFSLRHEYPTEWYRFLQPPTAVAGAAPGANMQINLSNDRFPFQYRGKTIQITEADLFVVLADDSNGGSGLSSFSLAPPNLTGASAVPANATPLTPVTSVGSASQFSTMKPPTPAPAVQGGPVSWILEYAGDLSQLTIVDMFLICMFSVS